MDCNLSKIAAGVIVFNPTDKMRFQKCIQSILYQVKKLYIFDNSTQDTDLDLPSSAIYMTCGKNMGIAYGLNCIMRTAKEDGFGWVITIDQDSILPDKMVHEYKRYVGTNDRLAIICPQVIDVRRAYMKIEKGKKEQYVHGCITSASCTSLTAWEKVGGFDEWLFIDLVDNEFCKRLIASGFQILRLNKLVLNQEFGKIIPKTFKKQQFWIRMGRLFHNENIAKFSYKKFVDPMRVYYTNRNIIYVNRKLRKYGSTAYDNYNCKNYLEFIFCFSLPSLLRAQEKKKVFQAIICGIVDGLKKNVDPWTAS